jgi:predicted PhzF superfamily epimerase YddE/YHI9
MAYVGFMSTPLFQVDAFTRRVLHGNPAAVCVLEQWPSDSVLQRIAQENNLSETAFLVHEGPRMRIRWFTPTVEVDLCGHATLASAWVYFHRLDRAAQQVIFDSKSGPLQVWRDADELRMRLPNRAPVPCEGVPRVVEGLRSMPTQLLASSAYLAVFEHESQVRDLDPDFSILAALDREGVVATAPSDDPAFDFVSRYFVPSQGINEDPVTGSTHCILAPYWAERLGRHQLRARQISARTGTLTCEVRRDHVVVGGAAVLYLEGMIDLAAVLNTAASTETPNA